MRIYIIFVLLLITFSYSVNYSNYGSKKTSSNNKAVDSTFRKRVGNYVHSHVYADTQARQLINHAALTGNGLVSFKH